jgi:uncharacterized protein YprB with RNaseH-like and TPR domain
MSALAERLMRLRREAGLPAIGATTPGDGSGDGAAVATAPRVLPSQPPPSVTARAPVPESIRRLLGIRARASGLLPRMRSLDREVPGLEIAPGLRLVEQRIAADAVPEACDLRFVGPAFAHADGMQVPTRHLLHFDTETTGLAGGTGTRAFMIGAADWHAGALRVRQLLITTLSAEPAMLDCFAGWLDRDTTLVSYNGRCYDAPLLATRYRLARMRNPLEGLAHADLLFAVRRRFRGVWENCRLGTVERRWLGVLREDDLPGSEAPRAWLDYLRGGDARDLRRVLAHNDQDVRTLGTLCLKLVALHAGETPVALHAGEPAPA